MKHWLLMLLLVLGPAASLSAQTSPAPGGSGDTWKAGVATANITPKTMMWMAGFASRTKPAEGVDTELFAKAIVLEGAEAKPLVIITLDLISIPRVIRQDVAKRIQADFGIPTERLLINASHTHSGPELRWPRAADATDKELRTQEAISYSNELADTLVRITGEALNKRVPSTASFTQARCGFAMNRRRPTANGYVNSPYSAGPVDHRVPVLRIQSVADKKDIALLFGYACHCTILGGQRFNADYAGAAQAFLEARHPGAVAMFINGCSGDQNPYPRNDQDLVEAHGRSLALAVEAALLTPPVEIKGSIRSVLKEIPLKLETPPTREALEKMVASNVKLDARLARHLLEQLDAGETLMTEYPYPVQVIRFGDALTMVTLGGEVVVDYSLRLQKEIRDQNVWVAGYSNDVMTYIPSRRVWDEGGYEAGEAMKWNWFPSRWAPELEETIVGTVHALRKELP